jgi:hypothetical protein
VALSAILSSGPHVCWRCGKPGHIRAFCQEEPIRGRESGKANVAFAVHDDADIWLDEISQSSNSDVWEGAKLYVYVYFSLFADILEFERVYWDLARRISRILGVISVYGMFVIVP